MNTLIPVIKAGNGDVAVLVKDAAEDACQNPDWILRAAAKDAGMQIAVSGFDLDLVIDQSTQRGGYCRGVRVPHAGVANQREIGLELAPVLFKKWHEILRADFFFTFNDHGDVDRQRPGHGFPGPAGFDEGHQLALIVLGAARNDDFASIGVRGNRGLERRTVPKIERVNRLYVIMTIEQHVRPAFAGCFSIPVTLDRTLGNDGGMTGCWPDFGLKT